ncbi:hypothetical protein CI109_102611 [Kwoniella shandongensis]|uniref:Uncharacterized protein n=1 Tax=Kwoniella shandongensis TaxID=1734106 RepID=A0A5M6BU97_9TREE|nr:uncharacterized protein CI109_005193 [Kwoniella shandongensis]KAA5526424.1 hypothetical protein CI109_005193 [Kwoniella shandongensis]
MPRFLSCFGDPSDERKAEPLLSTSASASASISTSTKKGCIFCNVSVEKGFNIAYEDDQLIAFHDRTPRAKTHLLVIPRYHAVDSVRGLTSDHLPLLRAMILLAHRLVPPDPPPKMGFHIPPFSSVPHLHLHVFSGPHTFVGGLKYPISSHGKGKDKKKGLGWFVTAEQVEETLGRGGRVRLGRS